jgi:hypothetical protein
MFLSSVKFFKNYFFFLYFTSQIIFKKLEFFKKSSKNPRQRAQFFLCALSWIVIFPVFYDNNFVYFRNYTLNTQLSIVFVKNSTFIPSGKMNRSRFACSLNSFKS